jgi:hypothetical protein
MIVFVITTSDGAVGVAKDKEIAKACVNETWPDHQRELIQDTSRGVMIAIRTLPKVGEREGSYVTTVRITPLELIEYYKHL